jgi:hypothetical protein
MTGMDKDYEESCLLRKLHGLIMSEETGIEKTMKLKELEEEVKSELIRLNLSCDPNSIK